MHDILYSWQRSEEAIILLFSECWPAVDSYKTRLNCFHGHAWCQQRREVGMFFAKSNVWLLWQHRDEKEFTKKADGFTAAVFSCSTAASNLVLDRLNQIGEVVAFRRRDWAVEIEVAAGRRSRAQQVSRGQGCNLMWHGFGRLWIALFCCLPHFETAMPHLLTHFRIITQWQGYDQPQDTNCHR